MDITKWIELLSTTPPWFKTAVGVWIIGGALLLIRFLNFPAPTKKVEEVHQTTPSLTQTEGLPVSTQSPPDESGLTPESYFNKLQELGDRFYEKSEYLKSIKGKTVKWSGYVDQVTEREHHLSITLKTNLSGSKIFWLDIPPEMRVKAFSLHRDDLVQATGQLEVDLPNMPGIEGKDFILLKPSPRKA